MRALVLLLVGAVALAGCVGQDPSVLPAADSDPTAPGASPGPGSGSGGDAAGDEAEKEGEPERPSNHTPREQASPENESAGPPKDEPTFCKSEDSCTFWDDVYHEYVLYDVDTPTVDVLIVPSASPGASQDTQAIRQAVEAWGAGIQTLGASWFSEGLALNVYVLGVDTPPQEALDDPEIIVLSAEYNPVLLFGIGYQLPSTPCRGDALESYAPHSHGGMTVYAARCESGGFTCIAANTNFLLGGTMRLYDLVAHEFGHCLGVGHVGDALDFSAKRVPIHDIMSYQTDEDQVHCVSTLNVRVLEGIYAPLLGVSSVQPLSAGDFYPMDPRAYAQVTCANPS